MTEDERRQIALDTRPAIQVFADAIRGMRRVLPDDAHYLAFVHHLMGVCIAEKSWLEGVAKQREASHAAAGERGDGNYEAARRTRFPLPLAPGGTGNAGDEEFPG